jgi:DNA modification methylase
MCLNEAHGDNWSAYHGDCVDVVRQLPDASVGFSIYSPPFSNIFCYSDSANDMGNSASDSEFRQHYGYLIQEKLRVTKPGRLTAVHCSDLPSTKWKDGIIGCKDFSGDIHDLHLAAGWHFVRRITVWRDPVVEMTRTKALNLLHKQILKDSTKSWPGMADYVMLFRAPGENTEPVGHSKSEFPVEQWQKWASPVWMDIRQTNTLNVAMAREGADERHLCPLQLDLIERALVMWSNPGDVVLSPFMGVGSEGVQAVKHRRKFVGVELKQSYFDWARRHLRDAQSNAVDLFAS